MILEGIITTQGSAGILNIAPMGARLVQGLERFRLRPYETSSTYKNLRETGEGVFHITDDVLLLTRAAIGEVVAVPTAPAKRVRGRVLLDSCRYYEFKVVEQEEAVSPGAFLVDSVETGRFRDFLGFNRAKHAVIEAAILATRIQFLPAAAIMAEFEKLSVIVEKTAGPDEFAALEIINSFLQDAILKKQTLDDSISK